MKNKKDFYLKLAWLAVSCGIFIIDQISKSWATHVLQSEGDRQIIPDLLDFVYAQNTGVAFNMLVHHGAAGRFGLSIVALAAAVLVLFYYLRVPVNRMRLLASLAILLAGIAGNVADRLRLGFVTDFIEVHYRDWYFPIFNIADAAVCIGAGLLIIDMLLTSKNSQGQAGSMKTVSESSAAL